MKKLLLGLTLIASFSSYADYSKLILTCQNAEDGETTYLVKDHNQYDDGNLNSFRVTSSIDGFSFFGIYEEADDLSAIITTTGFKITSSDKHYLDTNGNVGIPDNLYTEQLQTFVYNSVTKIVSETSVEYKKTLFTKVETSRDEFTYKNCVENYRGEPDFNF